MFFFRKNFRKVFFLCMTPGILNGLHISSYVFLGHPPDHLVCVVAALNDGTNGTIWNYDQIANISMRYIWIHSSLFWIIYFAFFFIRDVTNKCHIRNFDYAELRSMGFENAFEHVQNMSKLPQEVSCLSMDGNRFYYDNYGYSIVPEVFF